jgi:hypothetical protein
MKIIFTVFIETFAQGENGLIQGFLKGKDDPERRKSYNLPDGEQNDE